MKKNLFLISLCFSALFLTTNSCTKEDQEEVKEAVVGTMNADIAGASWIADAPAGSVTTDRITVSGVGTKKSIALTIEGVATGTYNISISSITGAVLVTNTDSASTKTYVSKSGKIIISDINTSSKRISGFYDFKAFSTNLKDSVTVSSGQFTNLKY
ncbi:MAG: DUF6252 family protein [Bacteroidota bacterium]